MPAKMNAAVFGNLSPPIHGHLVPRFFSDDPTLALNMHAEEVRLEQQNDRRIVQAPASRRNRGLGADL